MKTHLLRFVVLVGIFGLFLPPAPVATGAPPRHPAGFVYAEGDRLYLDGQPFIMKGFNYFPRDYGWTSMADWDWQAIDREFALAESLHCNTIRTGISYQYSTDNVDGRKGPLAPSEVSAEHLAAIDRLLELADKHHLKVVLWLCDGLYWELWDPAQFPLVQQHLNSLIPRYANDARIAAWDLFTDLDGTMLLPAPTGAFGATPLATKDNMVGLLRRMAEAVRAMDPNHLLCVGFCWAFSALLVQDFTDFLFPQFLGADYPAVLQSNAAGDPEVYIDPWALSGDRTSALERIEAKIRSLQAQLRRPMPIVLSEYGTFTAPPDSSEAIQAAVYEAVCEVAFLRLHLAGALPWALTDFTWPPKAPTYVPPDAPQWQAPEQTFGAFDASYRPKAAAAVVARYHAEQPALVLSTMPNRLAFVFSQTRVPAEQDPDSEDTRPLAAALDSIAFIGAGDEVLLRLDIGTPEARPYLESGFYADEGPWGSDAKTFAWVGGADRTGVLRLTIPAGTIALVIHAYSELPGSTMDVLLGAERIGSHTLKAGWRYYRIELARAALQSAEATHTIYGELSLPFSEGLVTVQTSVDGVAWTDVGQVAPEGGRFQLRVPLPADGHVLVRASFSGAGIYQGVTSEVLTLKPIAATSAPSDGAIATEPAPTRALAAESRPATAPPAPDAGEASREKLFPWLPLLALLGVAALGVCVAVLRARGGTVKARH
ncbi:MAG: hypothetical protein ACUVX9_06075 [Anaerolineae bacterium]